MDEPINFIRCYGEKGWGEEWLAELFADVPLRIIDDPNFQTVLPRSIYAIDGVLGLDHVPERFLQAVAATGQAGLLHEGDEFLRGPYSIYRHFDFVIRPYPAPFLRSRGVMAIPCGYCNDIPRPEHKPASQRAYAWSFTGQRNAARVQMAEALGDIAPNYCHIVDQTRGQKHIPRAEFLGLLRDSAFAPCPMGNAHLETARHYEALECGAIPLGTRRAGLDYFERLFGTQHRIPLFLNWAEARGFAKDLMANPAKLDRVQREIMEWWASARLRLRSDLKGFIEQGMEHSFRNELQRDFEGMTSMRVQAPRLLEILAHHDANALMGRAERVYRRGIRKVWHVAKGGRTD